MTPVGNILKNFLLDILAPKSCVFCESPDTDLCHECKKHIPRANTNSCPICLTPTSRWMCQRCRQSTSLDALTFPFYFHTPAVQEIIHLLKYQGMRDLSWFLGEAMADEVSYYPFHDAWKIIPIPLHRQRLNDRGYNQAELMAEVIAKKLSLSLENNILIRTRFTETQVGLNRHERQRNLADAFAISQPERLMQANILLIDDVATTLTTLETCTRLLKSHGASLVWALTAARADGSN